MQLSPNIVKGWLDVGLVIQKIFDKSGLLARCLCDY